MDDIIYISPALLFLVSKEEKDKEFSEWDRLLFNNPFPDCISDNKSVLRAWFDLRVEHRDIDPNSSDYEERYADIMTRKRELLSKNEDLWDDDTFRNCINYITNRTKKSNRGIRISKH